MTPGRTVLVVDDNEVVRALVLEILTRRGCQVLATADPAEALRLARTQTLDAVLTDLNLAGESGLALARELKAAGGAAPVWVMSGSSATDPGPELQQAGVAGFIRKPFTPSQLWQRLEPTLGSGAATASPPTVPVPPAAPVRA